MTEKSIQKIDIFISSPCDVGEERNIASEVIEQLNSMSQFEERCVLKPLSYEKIVPAAVGESPQRAVDRYMMEADQADIFICILWSRMGTPVIDSDGGEYQSGTEYEFIKAYQANQKSGKPAILLYRAMKSIPLDADFKQAGLVQDFFKRFEGKDAEFKGLYGNYKNNEEFENILRRDLDKIISDIIQPVSSEKPSQTPVYSHSELPAFSPRLKDFVTHNRADEITKALTYLEDHRILLITGMGGIGKTTLARALLEIRSADVPLPFWFDFSKKMDATPGDVLLQLAGYMNAPGIAGFRAERREPEQNDINRLIGELQKREELWLVFDNLETILKDDRKFRDEDMDLLFASLRASSHNAKIIITSRILPELKNGKELIDAVEKKQIRELEGLLIRDAVYYLEKNGFESVDKKVLEKVAQDVDGHPFALELLVGIANDMGVSNALKEIEFYRKEKLNKIIIQRRLFEKLAGDEKELLERISVFRKPESLNALKIMTTDGISLDELRSLIRKSLLKTDKTENFWLHPLIRDFSYEDLKNKKETHQLAFSYYLPLKLPEKRTNKNDVQSLIEACYHACRAGEYDEAGRIIFDRNLHEDLDIWGEYRTLIELYGGLLPEDHFSDNYLLSKKQTHSFIIGNMGIAYRNLGQVEKAIQYYEKALAIAVEIGDRRNEDAWLENLGIAYWDIGQVEKAIQYYEKALAIAVEIGDRRGEGTALGNLGNAYSDLGQVEKAIQYYEKALAIAMEIGDRRNEDSWLGNLGIAYQDLGQVEKAIQYYERAFAIAVEIGDRRGKGIFLGNLGNANRALGQVEKAIQYDEQAFAIAVEIGDRKGEGNNINNLGFVFHTQEKYTEALACYLLAREIRIQIKDPNLKTTELNLNKLKETLGENEFEKLMANTAPKAKEIVRKMLEGAKD